eukprot:TRINITY_DN3320_c2_g3_i1.p1 TRINITY_DN3320_c2_g3~~TRINITY_DN3320_c2_g3_i1.p1  ORF type:complete len:162 (-),score=41.29 TRINITY_DN3320_c2_g3_i1:19-504(-)
MVVIFGDTTKFNDVAEIEGSKSHFNLGPKKRRLPTPKIVEKPRAQNRHFLKQFENSKNEYHSPERRHLSPQKSEQRSVGKRVNINISKDIIIPIRNGKKTFPEKNPGTIISNFHKLEEPLVYDPKIASSRNYPSKPQNTNFLEFFSEPKTSRATMYSRHMK